jgi:hypothetical protein
VGLDQRVNNMAEKVIIFTQSPELQKVAENLKARYYNIIGYVDLDKIFFAFKGGDINEHFQYEISGVKNDWVKYAHNNQNSSKTYCLCTSYAFYQMADGPLLEWTILDLLYSCDDKMNGKIRKKDIHEYSRLVKTLDDLEYSIDWRKNIHLPSLLGDETIMFYSEDESI